MTEDSLFILGVIFILCSLGLGANHFAREEGWDGAKRMWRLLAAYVAMLVLFFSLGGKMLVSLYGVIGLGCIGYWFGRAIINQAHNDIGPDESKNRRSIYQLVQLVVVFGVIWLIGVIVGIDWSEVLRSEP